MAMSDAEYFAYIGSRVAEEQGRSSSGSSGGSTGSRGVDRTVHTAEDLLKGKTSLYDVWKQGQASRTASAVGDYVSGQQSAAAYNQILPDVNRLIRNENRIAERTLVPKGYIDPAAKEKAQKNYDYASKAYDKVKAAYDAVLADANPGADYGAQLKLARDNVDYMRKQMEDARSVYEYYGGKVDRSTDERIDLALRGALGQTAAGFGGALASMYEGGTRGSKAQIERDIAEMEKQYESAKQSYLSAYAKYQNSNDPNVVAAANAMREAQRNIDIWKGMLNNQSLEETAEGVYGKVNGLADRSAGNIALAKQGLGTVGQGLVDVGVGGIQMLGDVGLGMLTGGGVLPVMAARSFGSAALEARNNGGTYEQQFLYGAVSAGVEVLTEKISDGIGLLKHGGSLDDVVENAIREWIKTDAGRAVALTLYGVAGEAAEEAISALVGPAVKMIYEKDNASAKEAYTTKEGFKSLLGEVLQEAVVGGILGGAGAGGGYVGGQNIGKLTQMNLTDAAQAKMMDEKGFDKKTSSEQARLISKQLSGEGLSAREQAKFDNNWSAQEALSEMQQQGATPDNPLYNAQTRRTTEKLVEAATKATDEDFAAFSMSDLLNIAQAANAANDSALMERVTNELANRKAESDAQSAIESPVDATADTKGLASRLNPQLRELGDRNEPQRPLESTEFDENGNPIPESYQSERAPVPQEAPPESVYGNLTDEQRETIGQAPSTNAQQDGTMNVPNTKEANNGRKNDGSGFEGNPILAGRRSAGAVQEGRTESGLYQQNAGGRGETSREAEVRKASRERRLPEFIKGEVVQESNYSDSQKALVNTARDDGFESVTLISGERFDVDGVDAAGYVIGRGLFLANDSPETPTAVKDHEDIHLWSEAIPVGERYNTLRKIIISVTGGDSFSNIFQAYIIAHDGKYSHLDNASFYAKMCEEILGDMNSGLDRFGVGVDKFKDAARSAVEKANLKENFFNYAKAEGGNNESGSLYSSGFENAVKKAASGDVKSLTNKQLKDVLNYALDRASPETKGDPLLERATNVLLDASDTVGEKASPKPNFTSYLGYTGNSVGSLNVTQSENLVHTLQSVLNELDRRGVKVDDTAESDISNYANKFGVNEIENKQNVRIREDMSIPERQAESNKTSEYQAERDWDKKKKPAIMESLKKGNDIVESFNSAQENGKRRKDIPVSKAEKTTWTVNGKEVEVSGWVTPSKVDSKALKKAEDAVKAKGEEADIKDRISLLEARRDYLQKVAEQTQKARSDFYGSEDIEQRKADLGYMADNIKEQLEQLDADMGYMSDELDNLLENNPDDPKAISLSQAIEEAQRQRDNLNIQLESLRDEYRHLKNGDSEAARNVRRQIDSVTSELRNLYRKLDGVSKRAERADWGSTKRTIFNAESAALEDSFKNTIGENGSFFFDNSRGSNKNADSDILSGETYTAAEKKQAAKEASDFRKKLDNIVNAKGELFKAQTEADQAPDYDDTDDPKAKLSKTQRKNQKKRQGKVTETKPVTQGVADAMLHLQEDVKGILDSDAPLRHVLNLVESINSYEDAKHEMNWLTKNGIADTAREIKEIYNNKNMDTDFKADLIAEATTRLLQQVATRVDRTETNRARGLKLESSIEANANIKESKTKLTKAGRKAANLLKSMQLNPTTAFKMADGFDKSGSGTGYWIARQIENSVAREQMLTADVHGRYAELRGEKGFDDFVNGKSTVQLNANDKDGNSWNKELTEQQAIEFIKLVKTLQTQQVGNKSRLDTISGFAFEDKNGNREFVEASQISDAVKAANDLEKSLSPAAKKYLKITNGILFDLGKQVDNAKRRTTGIGFTNSDFKEGNYYHLSYLSKGQKGKISDESGDLFSPFGKRTKTSGGYVRIASAVDTVDRYIRNAVYAASYGELADTLEFLNTPALGLQGLSNAATNSFGAEYGRMFDNYVNDVARTNVKEPGGINDVMRTTRQLLQQGALRFSVSVPIKQVASYWNAMGVLTPEALAQAYRFKATKAKGYGKDNLQLQYRAVGGIDPTLSEMLNNQGYLSQLKKKSKIIDAWDKAISTMDYRTVDDIYHACIIDVKNSFPSVDPKSQQFADIVNSLFKEAVLATQPTFNANARSEYQRTNNEFIRALGMFRTQQTQNYNRAVTALGEYKAAKGTILEAKAKQELRQTLSGQFAAALEFGALSIIADLARHKLKPYKKDDEEGGGPDWGKVFTRLGMNTIESLAGNVWFGNYAAQLIIDGLNGDNSVTSGEYRGVSFGSFTSAVNAASSVLKAAGSIAEAIREGDISKLDVNSLRYGITNTAQLFGVPANNVTNLASGLAMYIMDGISAATDGRGKFANRAGYDKTLDIIRDLVNGTYTENSAKHQIDIAFQKGDIDNVLYNLAILDADARARAEKNGDDDPNKGHKYLADLLGPPDEKKEKAEFEQAEIEEYGHKLSGNERIANYLVDSDMKPEDIDAAIEQYASSGGYNVLYEALRHAGMSPKDAVNELYGTDNKTGLSTTIMDDESVESLLAGQVNPGNGTENDIPALQPKNLDQYVDYATGVRVFIETQNYSELDKLIKNYSKLDSNTQAVLAAKDSNLMHLIEVAGLGITSSDYYAVKAAQKQSQINLDLSSKEGSPNKMVALGISGLSKAKQEALMNSEWLGISNTAKVCYDVLSDYGYSISDVGKWLLSTDFSWEKSNGTISNIEAAQGLRHLKGLTDPQRRAIYEALKPQLTNPYKINDWGKYSYDSEIAYIDRNGYQVGKWD